MRPDIASSRSHPSTHSVDHGALVCTPYPAPRHLCGPVAESFVVMPRATTWKPAPVLAYTVPEWLLAPLSDEAKRQARQRISRYSSPVALLWDQDSYNLVEDKAVTKLMRHPSINLPCGPIRLHDRQREQARLALRAIRAMLWTLQTKTK